jgi:hypothetical protein
MYHTEYLYQEFILAWSMTVHLSSLALWNCYNLPWSSGWSPLSLLTIWSRRWHTVDNEIEFALSWAKVGWLPHLGALCLCGTIYQPLTDSGLRHQGGTNSLLKILENQEYGPSNQRLMAWRFVGQEGLLIFIMIQLSEWDLVTILHIRLYWQVDISTPTCTNDKCQCGHWSPGNPVGH